jgi:uncharacterized coiled-coil protein SlyX
LLRAVRAVNPISLCRLPEVGVLSTHTSRFRFTSTGRFYYISREVKTTFSLPFLALLVFALVALPQQAMAQSSDKECEALMTQIDRLADKLAEAGQGLGNAEGHLDKAEKDLQEHGWHAESKQSLENSISSLKNTIASRKSTISKLKLSIANLVEKLCACCGKGEPSGPAQQPTPSTTDKVTDILKTIGGSVSIGVGGGRGDHRHTGEDRHRTADKVSTDKTKTHTTSPTTTGHKTVTGGCKCHPCTCSPCTCH